MPKKVRKGEGKAREIPCESQRVPAVSPRPIRRRPDCQRAITTARLHLYSRAAPPAHRARSAADEIAKLPRNLRIIFRFSHFARCAGGALLAHRKRSNSWMLQVAVAETRSSELARVCGKPPTCGTRHIFEIQTVWIEGLGLSSLLFVGMNTMHFMEFLK